MSTTSLIHPFPNHIFTPTIYDKKADNNNKFNFWIIIVTGTVFFCILSWYNFFLSLYNYWLKIPPQGSQTSKEQLTSTFGFAIIWTLFAIILCVILTHKNLLSGNNNVEFHDSSKLINKVIL